MVMDLAQNSSRATELSGRGYRSGGAVLLTAVGVIVAVAAVAMTALIASPRDRLGVASQADPFVQPAAIEFRQGEHAVGAGQADPFVQPAAIEFRQGEHGMSTAQSDPFVQAPAIEFRRGEHGMSTARLDPFLQPAAIDFRQSEHDASAIL
jgi:hypothetical protein